MAGANGNRGMKIGVMLPLSSSNTRKGARWSEICDMAKAAEDVGLDSIWIPDHLIYQMVGEDEPTGYWEVWSFLSALAASTKTIELGTLVLAMGWRNPALLAKMADAVDEISDGRLILGLGTGYHKLEFDAFGYPFDYKVSRFQEAIQIVCGLLRDGEVDFDGKYHSARDCELFPRGPRPNGPPILIGTNLGSPRMHGIIAKHADMWNLFYDNTSNRVEGFVNALPEFEKACQEHGRDAATLESSVGVMMADASADPWWDRLPSTHFAEDAPLVPLNGEPEKIAEELAGYAAAGAAHLQISLEPTNVASIEALAPVLEAFDARSK